MDIKRFAYLPQLIAQPYMENRPTTYIIAEDTIRLISGNVQYSVSSVANYIHNKTTIVLSLNL